MIELLLGLALHRTYVTFSSTTTLIMPWLHVK